MADTLEALRAASRQLDEFLAEHPSGLLQVHSGVPDLAPLMEALDRVDESLRDAPLQPGLEASAGAAVSEYVEKLKQLQDVLERLQPQLEGRRNAIRARLGKIRAALDWADSFSHTRE